MSAEEVSQVLKCLPEWKRVDDSIERDYRFKTYRSGLDFAYVVGNIAEEQNHHPDIWIGWRRVKITLSTHAIHGLSRNDFIMGAKSEMEYSRFRNISA
jgi:4a-hydroxytetrahydrobiopterin dehydratase